MRLILHTYLVIMHFKCLYALFELILHTYLQRSFPPTAQLELIPPMGGKCEKNIVFLCHLAVLS